MSVTVLGVIPARLGSTRFPGKALHVFRGKPLLYYVWREMNRSRLIDRLVIATDSREIHGAAVEFGAEVVVTSNRHQTGTDRAAEVAGKLGGSIVVNIQGDSLALKAGPVDKAVAMLRQTRGYDCSTLVRRVDDDEQLFNPNVVKVAVSDQNQALWFSRYPIPYLQHPLPGPRCEQHSYWAHIGVYVLRRKALMAFAASPRTAMEKAESLEQLRLIEHGRRMIVVKTKARTVSVDSPEDVGRLARILK